LELLFVLKHNNKKQQILYLFESPPTALDPALAPCLEEEVAPVCGGFMLTMLENEEITPGINFYGNLF